MTAYSSNTINDNDCHYYLDQHHQYQTEFYHDSSWLIYNDFHNEQTIMNNDHLLHHNHDTNQNNVASLMTSLNSSPNIIIQDLHNVSTRESSIISSSISKNNTYCNPYNVNNSICVNEDEFYPHTCRWSDCFLSFTDMPELVKHIEEAHVNSIPEEKHRYSCQWTNCRRTNQPFNARYKLLIHMRVHSGEKPYPCEHESCKKSFSRLENLKIHIRSHTGEKPYCCRYEGCKKAFTNSSDRIKHHKTHLDAKPYSCSYNDCDKRYTDPSSLRKHLKLHKKLDSDSNKVDNRLDYIDGIKNNSSLDDKLSQSWSAGYTQPCQINSDGNWSTSTDDYTQSKLANSFTAGCSSNYVSPIELHDDAIKNNSSLDDKLSQSWSAGYTKQCQINSDGNWSTSTNDYTQSRLANSFTAGCSSSYVTPIELHDSNLLNVVESLPSFACLVSKSLDSL